jgi:hypothetical protein
MKITTAAISATPENAPSTNETGVGISISLLIIAGVSQRFVPHVYGLGNPKHDRQTVLYRTARQSIEPHNPYEKFIARSFIWFLVGTVLEAVFFFAKATA